MGNFLSVEGEMYQDMNKHRGGLIPALIGEFEKAKVLLLQITDEAYCLPSNGTGSVGGHVRHNLNFVDAVLVGVRTGVVDYNTRVRDPLVETDRHYAAARVGTVIDRLNNEPAEKLGLPVEVLSECDPALRHYSTVSRELEFVHSHTVHHHALIAEKLAAIRIKVERNFGVAPSTLEYWKRAAA